MNARLTKREAGNVTATVGRRTTGGGEGITATLTKREAGNVTATLRARDHGGA